MSTSPTAQEILRARARALARPLVVEPWDVVPRLGLQVGASGFAVELTALAGIHPARRTAPIPGSPPWLLGLAAVEGAAVPTVRLDALLGAGAPAGHSGRWLVLVGSGDERVALQADQIAGVLEAAEPRADLPDGLSELAYRVASGMVGDRLLIDPGALFRALFEALNGRRGAAAPSHGPEREARPR